MNNDNKNDTDRKTKLEIALDKFIKSSKDKFIFSCTGHKSYGKSETFKKMLDEIELDTPTVKIWSNLLCAHENMVIEQIPLIVEQLREHGLFNITKDDDEADKGEADKSEDSLENYLDNVHNIQAFIDALRRGLKKEQHGTCLIVLDNAENIFGRHLVTSKNKWEMEFFSQWRLFLKEIIELNDSNFVFKVIMISNEKIFSFPELENYIENYPYVEDSSNDTLTLPKNIRETFCNLLEIFKCEHPEKINSRFQSLLEKIITEENKRQYSFLNDFSEFAFFLDYALINFGHENELLNLFVEIFKEKKLLDCKTIPKEMKKYLIHNNNFRYSSYSYFIESYSESIQSYIRSDQKETNLIQKETNLIQLEFSLYKWIKTLDGQHPTDDYYYHLGIILCCPTHKHMFNDVAILLQQHGYTSHLQEALNDVIKKISDDDIKKIPASQKLPLRVRVRMKILNGNLYYYNYPENYLKALKCYVEALEDFNQEKDLSKHKCKRKCCAMMQSLILYEIASTIYQILIGNLYQYFSFTDKQELNCIFKQLRNQLSWRLHFYPMDFPAGNIDWEDTLLRKHMQVLLKYLINHLSKLGYHRVPEDQDVYCWNVMLNPNYVTPQKEDTRDQKKEASTIKQQYEVVFSENVNIRNIDSVAILGNNSLKKNHKAHPPKTFTKNQRYAVAFLKNIDVLNINGIALLKLIRKLNLTLSKNRKGIKIHWYTLRILIVKSWGTYIIDVISDKRIFKSKIPFWRFNYAFSYLNFLDTTIKKLDEHYKDFEFYWSFLIKLHMLGLLVKDLRYFIEKYQQMGIKELQYNRYYSKNIPEIQKRFLTSIENLQKAIKKLKNELLGRNENKTNKKPVVQNQKNWLLTIFVNLLGRIVNKTRKEPVEQSQTDKEPIDQNQKTWRLARTYELLGDAGKLEVEFNEIHGKKNHIETLKKVLEYYVRAKDRYFRIDSHNSYKRMQEKITSIKLKIESIKDIV